MTRFAGLVLILVCAACGPQNPPASPGGGGEGGEGGGEEGGGEGGGGENLDWEGEAGEEFPDGEGQGQGQGDAAGGGGGGGDIAQRFVDAHNSRRAKHCAAPLTWSDQLAKVAQAWADELNRQGCAFEHSKTKYGENLAGGTAGHLDPDATVEMWYREVDLYNFKKGGFSMETGHFTQVVWKNTKQVGCGSTTCGGMDIIVCNYDPAGNYEGQYKANVVPEGC